MSIDITATIDSSDLVGFVPLDSGFGAMTIEGACQGAHIAGRTVTHSATFERRSGGEDYCFSGLSVFTGTILRKAGSVALTVVGGYDSVRGVVNTTYTILPASASGELVGIKGTGVSGGAPDEQTRITFKVEFAS